MTEAHYKLRMSELLRDGYTVIERAMPDTLAARLRVACVAVCNGSTNDLGVADTKAFDLADPLFRTAVQHGALLLHNLAGPRQLEFDDMRYISSAIIPKYLHEPRREWHVDWWAWDTPETQRRIPPQIGVIFYLDDADRTTGAFVALAGSHRREIPGILGSQNPHPDERLAELRAGDAVVFDARMLHAVTGNSKTPLRIAVTLWYLLGWSGLSEGVKATTMLCMSPSFAPYLGNLYPDYAGSTSPVACVKIPKF